MATTVLLQSNYLAGRAGAAGSAQPLRLRLANEAGNVAQFQFVKPSSSGSWADSNANRFIIEPDDGSKAKFNFAAGATAKNFVEVDLLQMGAPITISSDFMNITSTATINNLSVTNLRVDSMTVVEGTETIILNVTNDKVIAKYLDISGAATIQALTVTAASDFKGNAKAGSLEVTGTASITGALDVTGTADLKAAAKANSLSVTGALLAGGLVEFSSSVTASSLTVSNNAVIGNDLTVSGVADLKGSMKVNNLDITGNLTATGNGTFGGTLNVTGAAAITGTIAVTGAAGGQSLAGLESSLAGRNAIELKMKGVIRRTSDMPYLLAKRADEGFHIQLDHWALIHSGG
jgi:cytoskeletal protein CcmA (bactofilin family)